MKYCKSLTLDHPVSKANPECLKKINDLNASEGFDENPELFDAEIVVLDMDCVEHKNALLEGRNRKASMDFVFTINDENTGDSEIVAVELRYNYIGVRNLKRDKLMNKVGNSINSLGSSSKVNNEPIFIFKSNLKQQAISRLFRMMPSVPIEYKVIDIYELKALYF